MEFKHPSKHSEDEFKLSMNRTRLSQDEKVYNTFFHENIKFLMELNAHSSELRRCFKLDMFAVLNIVGLKQMSYFLLMIIYPNTKEFKDCWPILEKAQERQYRHKVVQMLRRIQDEFPDFQFPEIISSRFLSPGGIQIAAVMWNLSLLAMQVQAKRDLGCHLLVKPSLKLKENLKSTSVRILKIHTAKNVKKRKNLESLMESFLKDFKEMKQSLSDKLHDIKASIMCLRSTLDDSELWNSLDSSQKNAFLDLKNDKEILCLKERLEEVRSQQQEHLRFSNSDFIVYWKKVIDSVINQEEHGHKYVLNGKFLAGRDDNNILTSKYFRNYIDIPEDGNYIRLLDHLNEPCKKMQSLKLVSHETDLSLHFKDWEIICKDLVEMKSDISKMEVLLNTKLSELTAKYIQVRGLAAEDQISLDSTLCASQGLCASTPFKNNYCGKPLDITPFQKPSADDYFAKTFKKMLERSLPISTRNSSESNISSPTVDELIERFERIQLSMKKKNYVSKKKDLIKLL